MIHEFAAVDALGKTGRQDAATQYLKRQKSEGLLFRDSATALIDAFCR